MTSDARREDAVAPVLVIAGPTASGKSSLAIALARNQESRLVGEIVSCDSMQVYRGFDIGTAKIPESERAGVPHHLLDVVDPADAYTAARFARDASEAITAIHARHRVAIVAGGTGFYLRALLDGLSPGPERDENLRSRLRAARPGALHRLLRRLDPEAARRLHPNDANKLIRAIEVCASGATISAMQARPREPAGSYRPRKILLDPPRAELRARINDRVREMFEHGLVQEAARLRGAGVPADAPAFRAVGYREALAVVEGKLDRARAIEQAQAATRQYAKRQATWFRRERWDGVLSGFGTEASVRETARQWVGELTEKRGECRNLPRNVSF